MDEQWEKIDSTEIHRNPWYALRQDNIVMPSGQMGKYTYVDAKTGVVIAALTEKNEIYLVGQYRYPVQKFSWELPMGSLESVKEDSLVAAKRELKEEVGLEAKNWEKIADFYYCNGISNQEGHVYVAENILEKEAQPDFTEFLSMKKVTLDEFELMIYSNEITDCPSIMAFYRLKLYLENK